MWREFARDRNKVLLLSQKAVEQKPFHALDTDWGIMNTITWENCNLRKYLNSEFISTTFDTDEQELIIETNITTLDQSKGEAYRTRDRIFLLSKEEVLEYMPTSLPREHGDVAWCTRTVEWGLQGGFGGLVEISKGGGY